MLLALRRWSRATRRLIINEFILQSCAMLSSRIRRVLGDELVDNALLRDSRCASEGPATGSPLPLAPAGGALT